MTFHLRPETEARLVTIAAAHGLSADDYLEALVERELFVDALDPASRCPRLSLMMRFRRTREERSLHLVGDPSLRLAGACMKGVAKSSSFFFFLFIVAKRSK